MAAEDVGGRGNSRAADALLDVVPDGTDGTYGLASGAVQFPILVTLAGQVRAGVATSHGDHDVGGLPPILAAAAGLPGIGDRHRVHRSGDRPLRSAHNFPKGA
jgi:hypothetical protein